MGDVVERLESHLQRSAHALRIMEMVFESASSRQQVTLSPTVSMKFVPPSSDDPDDIARLLSC